MTLLRWSPFAAFFLALQAVAGAQTCAATPADAARAVFATPSTATALHREAGYRARDIFVDPVLHHAWVRLQRCDAPSAPLTTFDLPIPTASLDVPHVAQALTPAEAMTAAAPRAALAVHAGESITLTFQDAAARIHLAATAQRAGSLGERIPLAIARSAGQQPHVVYGVVTGVREVEMQP